MDTRGLVCAEPGPISNGTVPRLFVERLPMATPPALTITITERVDQSVGDTLADRLRPFVPIEEVRVYFRKAADPAIQQLIQLIGSIEAWHYLAGGATFVASKFFGRLADLLATDAHASFKSWLKSDEGKPIAAAATALSDAARDAPGARVLVSLDVPDDIFGTVFVISSREPEATAIELLRFVAAAEAVVAVLSDADNKGEGAFNQPSITVTADGNVEVRWMAASDYKMRTVVIDKRADAA
jgi:hypothetical protein